MLAVIIWTKTSDGCHVASIENYQTPKYGSREGALTDLCEHLLRQMKLDVEPPWKKWSGLPAECRCGGWGAPTGCRGCGLRCMGG